MAVSPTENIKISKISLFYILMKLFMGFFKKREHKAVIPSRYTRVASTENSNRTVVTAQSFTVQVH